MAQDNRVLNELGFYCLKWLHKFQNFAAPKLTSNDPAVVQDHFTQQYTPIAESGTLPQIQVKYFYSKERIAYPTEMLSTVQYSRSGDSSINCLMDEQYNVSLLHLRGMTDKAFNEYLVRRMAAYITRWPAGVAYRGRQGRCGNWRPRPCRRRRRQDRRRLRVRTSGL